MGAYKALLPEQIEWAFAQWCNGTTQQQLADTLFVDVRTIQRMFKGRQKAKPVQSKETKTDLFDEG